MEYEIGIVGGRSSKHARVRVFVWYSIVCLTTIVRSCFSNSPVLRMQLYAENLPTCPTWRTWLDLACVVQVSEATILCFFFGDHILVDDGFDATQYACQLSVVLH